MTQKKSALIVGVGASRGLGAAAPGPMNWNCARGRRCFESDGDFNIGVALGRVPAGSQWKLRPLQRPAMD